MEEKTGSTSMHCVLLNIFTRTGAYFTKKSLITPIQMHSSGLAWSIH